MNRLFLRMIFVIAGGIAPLGAGGHFRSPEGQLTFVQHRALKIADRQAKKQARQDEQAKKAEQAKQKKTQAEQAEANTPPAKAAKANPAANKTKQTKTTKPKTPRALPVVKKAAEIAQEPVRLDGGGFTLSYTKIEDLMELKQAMDNLDHEDLGQRLLAIESVGRSHTDDPKIHLKISELAADPSADSEREDILVRHFAILALAELKTSNPQIHRVIAEEGLEHPSVQVRTAAAYSLGNLKTDDPEIIQKLVKTALTVDSSELQVRQAALSSLSYLTLSPEHYKRLTIKGLSDKEDLIVVSTIHLLGFAAPHDPWALTQITKALSHRSEKVRTAAVHAIGKLKESHSELDTTVLLLSALADSSKKVQMAAVFVFSKYPPDDLKTVRAVAEALSVSMNDSVKAAVIRLLGVLLKKDNTQDAKSIKDPWINEKIMTFFKSDSSEVRLAVVQALRKIKPDDLVIQNNLINGLFDPVPQVQWEAIWTLEKIHPESDEFYQKLSAVIPHLELDLSLAVLHFLQEIRPDNENIENTLAKLLNDQETTQEKKLEIIRTLNDLTWVEHKVENELVKALKDSDPNVRREAALALKKAGIMRWELFRYNSVCAMYAEWC